MSLENVVKDIIETAEKREQELLRHAKATAKAILEEAEKKNINTHEKTVKNTSGLVEGMEKKELSMLRLNLKKKALSEQKRILDRCDKIARDKISRLPQATRKKILKQLLKTGLSVLPDAKFYFCNPKDQKTIRELAPKLKFLDGREMPGGMVLLSPDQSIRLDLSFEQFLKQAMEDEGLAIHKALFG